MDAAEVLLEQVLRGETAEQRRQAFVALVAGEHWRLVLAPHVISRQSAEDDGALEPDRAAFSAAAPHIAKDEEKIHRALELVGTRFADDLVLAVVELMREEFVEHALVHLRTADGERATLLEGLLHQADRRWVCHPTARRVIRTRLRTANRSRIPVLLRLAEASILQDFVDELREFPPQCLEEWSALGRSGIVDELFINRALSALGARPDPLAYLLRIAPVPSLVVPRMMAAAKPDWLMSALELAITEGLGAQELIPLMELAVRLGGRYLSAALAWINMSRLGPELLRLADESFEQGRQKCGGDQLVLHRHPASANRALEHGRRGEVPDPLDAAALVRQLQGTRLLELVREILGTPRLEMIDSVLRPLCAVSQEAAAEVVQLSKSLNPAMAERARQACAWPDVAWPEEKEPAPEPPLSFGPLREGI